jgi:hypothetical protein
MRRYTWMLLAAVAVAPLAGCASAPKPVLTDSQLGRVIIYRNGVAYFERYAEPHEEKITLRVPAERVDDFLKSLSIVDEKSGEAQPISYPTMVPHGGYVDMTLELPKRTGRLRITYVTESPAWKPSYRVVLGEAGKAQLQGWAVVDNQTGEDWKQVRVGVGSTSALSFRYDLRSIRLVERVTLTTGEELAAAPPTGGSPYAVATRKVRVVGAIDNTQLAQIQGQQVALGTSIAAGQMQVEIAEEDSGGWGRRFRTGDTKSGGEGEDRTKAVQQQKEHGATYLSGLSNELKNSRGRVRVEGFAQSSDHDPQNQSLGRANAVRDQLIAQGVPESNIDVVANAEVNDREAVRITEAEAEPVTSADAAEADRHAADTQPVGNALFVSDGPMSLESEHSAMVSILNAATEAKRVYFYDPVSDRGSKQYAFNAVRIVNPSSYTLDAGPFTIYAKGQFLGEGLSEPILPKSVAFIPYALDQSIVADPEVDTREEIDKLLTIQRGVVTTETRRIRRTRLTVSNRAKDAAEVYVRHKVAQGFELTAESAAATTKVEKLGGAHLFRVDVKAGEAVELVIEEQTPLLKTVDIRTDQGIRDIGLFLSRGAVEPELQQKLDEIVKSHTSSATLQQKIQVLGDQMDVYRTRIDELSDQLASLRKVKEAQKLRGNLQTKMEEISNKLQSATMEMTDMQGQLMALRIDLQDKLADLSLAPKEAKASEIAAK